MIRDRGGYGLNIITLSKQRFNGVQNYGANNQKTALKKLHGMLYPRTSSPDFSTKKGDTTPCSSPLENRPAANIYGINNKTSGQNASGKAPRGNVERGRGCTRDVKDVLNKAIANLSYAKLSRNVASSGSGLSVNVSSHRRISCVSSVSSTLCRIS